MNWLASIRAIKNWLALAANDPELSKTGAEASAESSSNIFRGILSACQRQYGSRYPEAFEMGQRRQPGA